MEEILGLASGDFEGVEFAESSGSDGEEEEHASGAAAVVPRSDTTTTGNSAEISNVENTPGSAAAAGPSPAVMEVTTIVQVGGCLGCRVKGPRGRAYCGSNWQRWLLLLHERTQGLVLGAFAMNI